MYSVEKKVAPGVFPRAPGSTTLSSDKVQLVYNKFTPKNPAGKDATKINLIFAHGSGMNKGTWNYHIQKLYEANQNNSSWKLNNVIAVDNFSHGDSAELNREKIGWTFDWCDNGKDLVEVVKHEIRTTGDFEPSGYTRNILIGHSLGGYAVLWAGFLEPQLFDSIISVEPVVQYTQALNEWFFKRMIKAGKFIENEYPSVEAAHEHLKKKSFYNVMEKNVLDAFVDDELVVNKDGTVRVKAQRLHQVATYCGVSYSAERGMGILNQLEIPFYHITGADAVWTPRESVDWIREEVPEHLLETADMPKGGHLVHGEQPLESVKLWLEFIDKRAAFVQEHRKNLPEVKYNGDRKKIFNEQWKYLEAVDVEGLYYFGHVRPKL
ncbi:hypothetical protein FT663_02801 [Candidozyma haemuli var. vulneris]|uniref:AB hydrolase-1 domain-containing protein n=1 Tax=Candidozyma haemuli TaxID=45357 RepID=A0A2V1AZ72_9ASCO|nr:hypothetical protein CXQ85_005227 [[Candida] haemuloni]KAF3991300.1 hypothetical protein FT663_02801 [[Candida] haemuloni var. vulneris]KAF3991986.1 hypothetical protein FT662_01439 [[Candida] haemuloni var. vulneris]PVH22653.1 hypothetical protein CXQ85_005227 [[Candida] haemuloni]